MTTKLTDSELAIADQLLDEAIESFGTEFSRVFMRWRMNWLEYGYLRYCRALRPDYYPWADYDSGTRLHNRHDRKRAKRQATEKSN